MAHAGRTQAREEQPLLRSLREILSRWCVASFSLNPSAVARVLGAIAFILMLAHLGERFSHLELGYGAPLGPLALFNLSAERNIPAYFSMLLMLFVALLVALIAVLSRENGAPHLSKWIVLSVGFAYMAFDEAHERLMVPIRYLLRVTDPAGAGNGEVVLGAFYFAWLIPAVALVLLLGLYFLRFLLYLPATTRYRFLAAAALYLGGAIGFELIGGAYADAYGYDNWTYTLIATAEEVLEMAGLIAFIWALLKYCAETYREVRLGFGPQVCAPAPRAPRATTRPASRTSAGGRPRSLRSRLRSRSPNP